MTTDTTQNDAQAGAPRGEVFNSFVHITDDMGIHYVFEPGDPIPAWARPNVGDHVISHGSDLADWPEMGYTTDADPLDGTVFAKPRTPEVTAQARGFTAFADQDDDLGVVEPPAAPPVSGPGSNRAAWLTFAQQVGQPVTAAMSRQDIIDALVRNGHITD